MQSLQIRPYTSVCNLLAAVGFSRAVGFLLFIFVVARLEMHGKVNGRTEEKSLLDIYRIFLFLCVVVSKLFYIYHVCAMCMSFFYFED